MQVVIRQIKPEDTYALRLSVLKTCDAYEYQYQSDLDKSTIHFGAFIINNLVGIVSLMQQSNPHINGNQLQLRGMAIDIEFRKKGIGHDLIAVIKNFAITKNIDVIWCNAREKATGFYLNQGFEIMGNSFNIKNVGIHYQMQLLLRN